MKTNALTGSKELLEIKTGNISTFPFFPINSVNKLPDINVKKVDDLNSQEIGDVTESSLTATNMSGSNNQVQSLTQNNEHGKNIYAQTVTINEFPKELEALLVKILSQKGDAL